MLIYDKPLLSSQSPLSRHLPVPQGWPLNGGSTLLFYHKIYEKFLIHMNFSLPTMRSKLPQWKKSLYEICSLSCKMIIETRGGTAQPCFIQTGPFCNINSLFARLHKLLYWSYRSISDRNHGLLLNMWE